MSEVSIEFEPMDSEILAIEKVVNALAAKSGRTQDLEDFRREAIERFGEAGFRAEVLVYETDVSGVYWFTFVVKDRLEGEFDPDRQVHEVTKDILGLGEQGIIRSGGLVVPRHTHSHGHGHSHSHKH